MIRNKDRAPSRCWRKTSSGGFVSAPWGLMDVLSALRQGAWFQSGQHEFHSRQAAFAAVNGGELLEFLQLDPTEGLPE